MRMALLGGSLRPASYTYAILEVAAKKLHERQLSVDYLDLKKLNLPFCQGGEDYAQNSDVKHLRSIIKNADGLILSTPEYHGSVSGVLKNALDLLDEEHIRGKVVALIAVMGGVESTNALNTLRTICRHLHAWVIPSQLIVAQAHQVFDREGNLLDQQVEQRLDALLDQLIDGVRRLKS